MSSPLRSSPPLHAASAAAAVASGAPLHALTTSSQVIRSPQQQEATTATTASAAQASNKSSSTSSSSSTPASLLDNTIFRIAHAHFTAQAHAYTTKAPTTDSSHQYAYSRLAPAQQKHIKQALNRVHQNMMKKARTIRVTPSQQQHSQYAAAFAKLEQKDDAELLHSNTGVDVTATTKAEQEEAKIVAELQASVRRDEEELLALQQRVAELCHLNQSKQQKQKQQFELQQQQQQQQQLISDESLQRLQMSEHQCASLIQQLTSQLPHELHQTRLLVEMLHEQSGEHTADQQKLAIETVLAKWAMEEQVLHAQQQQQKQEDQAQLKSASSSGRSQRTGRTPSRAASARKQQSRTQASPYVK